jgi:hypothetical protein
VYHRRHWWWILVNLMDLVQEVNMGLTKVTMGLLGGLVAKVQEIMQNHSNIFLATAKAATGTFVDFDIPAGVKRVTVTLTDVSTNGTGRLAVRIGTPAIAVTGYRSFIGNDTGSSSNYNTTCIELAHNVAASDLWVSTCILSRQGDRWTISTTSLRNSAGYAIGVGYVESVNDIRVVRVTTALGTDQFDAGTINVSWEF